MSLQFLDKIRNQLLAHAKRFPTLLRDGIILAGFIAVIFGIYALDNSFSGRKQQASPAPSNRQSANNSAKSGEGKDTSNHAHSVSTPAIAYPSVHRPAPSVLPADILDVSSWKLTLPIGKPGDPDEITQPQLASYSLVPYFYTNQNNNGVIFRAPINGVTTSGSKFPRSELREMRNGGQKEAAWSTTQGTSTLTVRESIDHLPDKRPQLVAAQIHGPSAYLILIRLNGNDLFVESNGNNVGNLNADYKLGTVFLLQIVARDGHVFVSYNGAQKVDYRVESSGDYFKAGCYTQSNPKYGESPSSYGQTTLYYIAVNHT